jgi:hypothetical protein
MVANQGGQIAAQGRDENMVALRRRMAEIARPAVLRLPPFDTLKLESCLEPYKRFLDQRTPEKRARLVEAFISFMEFIIAGEVCRNKEEMALWDEISQEFQRYHIANYVPPSTLRPPEISTADARKLIVAEFSRSLPEFVKGKSQDRAALRLVKRNVHVDGIFVEFDFGTFGPGHFTPSVGTISPHFRAELSAVMCIQQRRWNFETAAECSCAAQEVIGYVQLVMPLLEEKVSQF